MRWSRWRAAVLVLMALIAVVVILLGRGDDPTSRIETNGHGVTVDVSSLPVGDDRTVQRVVDGDTIVVDGGTRVRLIGVDTPESVAPNTPRECFGEEASAFTGSLLPAGTEVRMVYDVERTDRYERTLAYVYRVDDKVFVNATLVAAGYASAATFAPNVAHADEFADLAAGARAANRGLWQACR